jgi:O-antigen/teichoic acid export membrane protein
VSFAERVRRGLVWSQFGRAVEMGSAYAASVLAARAFGAVGFGTYSVALSIALLGALATSLGFNEVLNLQVPRLAGEPGRVAWLLRILLRMRMALALVFSSALFLAAPRIALAWRNPALEPVLQAGALYALFYQVSLLLEYFHVGRLDIPRVARVRVAVQLLNLVAAAAALHYHLAPRQLLQAMACNSAAGVAWLLWGARGALTARPERFGLRPMLAMGLALWATNLVNYFVGRQADILLIGLFRPGTDEAGAYSVAAMLAMLLAGALLLGAEGVSLAAFSEVEARVDRAGLGRLWSLHVKMDVLLSLPFLAFGAVFAREIVALLYGAGFERAASLLAAYALVWVAARVLGGGTNMAVLYAMQSPRLPLIIYGACGALNLIGDLVLIPRLGARGAVIATGAAMLAAGLASGLVIRRRTGAFFPVVFALKVLVVSALGAVLARVLPRPPGLAGLLVAAAVVGVVTLFGLRLLRPLGDDDRRLLVKLSPRLEWLVARL